MERFWEIDSLRGIAIILMIISNLMTDLIYFNIYGGGIFWKYFAYSVASVFILLAGISLTLSYSRASEKSFKKYLKRGLKIFSWGLLITVFTWFFIKDFVIFGILHFIGISIILVYPLIKYKLANLAVGIGIILIGIYTIGLRFTFPYLLWLGFVPSWFYSVDYFPLLPWFGVFLIGIFIGNWAYPNYNPPLTQTKRS